MSLKILGISAFYHDSAATLVIDGDIVGAAQEERFTRKKHDSGFPTNAIKFCLEVADLQLDDLDVVVFYDKPLLKFERLLETYYGFAPAGVRSFIAAMPVWLREKMFLKRLIRKELKAVGCYNTKQLKLLFSEHHLSHAASAFYPSPYNEAAVLTIDGVGEWATASICHGKGGELVALKELRFPHSLGLLYSAFTYFLGFRVNSGEYKLMGLAPYGNQGSDEVAQYVESIKSELIEIAEDGSVWLNQKYFDYATGLRMAKDKKWERLFRFSRCEAETEFNQQHCNLALAIQQVTEEIVIKMAREAKRLTGADNLCLAGGVALNCVANGKLQNAGLFNNIFIQPAAGDAGGALGAALSAHYIYMNCPRETGGHQDRMKGSYLGPEFNKEEILTYIKRYDPVHDELSFEQLTERVVEVLDSGNVVGWFQGRMEFGPRALGNRSILGDARNADMQKRLNLKIKYRESFRPFAPSVIDEARSDYFELKTSSPYMLLVQQVENSRRKQTPENYDSLALREKLYNLRSDIPAITHVDFSARIQTVHKDTNPRYWELIKCFQKKTGYGLLVNTSFNVRGEPIVCTPEDAYRCFMRTEMDYLVIGNFLFDKKAQPEWPEKDDWREEYVLD